MLGNGPRIASHWEFSDTALGKLIQVVEEANVWLGAGEDLPRRGDLDMR